jgi:AcrR family transcriptional regulator
LSQQPAAGDDTDQRILDAAMQLIVRFGFDKTTINDIARGAKIAKSTLYLRYKTRDELLRALLAREARAYVEDWLRRVLADPDGGTLSGLYRNALLALRENAFIMALYGRDQRVLGSLLQRPEMQGLVAQRMAISRVFLEQMQAAGMVRADVDIHTVAYVLNSLQYGFLKIHEIIPPEQAPPLHEAVAVVAEMLDRMLSPPGGGDSETGKRVIREIAGRIRALLDAYAAQG